MLHSAPHGSLCAEAFSFTAIEADLEAFSPGPRRDPTRLPGGASAAAGLSVCVAGLLRKVYMRKASHLFKLSCPKMRMTHATRLSR